MFGDFLRRPRWTMEKRHAWICIRSFKMFGKNPRTLSQMDPNDWFDGAKQKITFNKSKYVGTFLHEKDANNGMIDQINYQAWHYYIAVAGFLQPTILFNQILWRSFGDFKGHRFGVFDILTWKNLRQESSLFDQNVSIETAFLPSHLVQKAWCR